MSGVGGSGAGPPPVSRLAPIRYVAPVGRPVAVASTSNARGVCAQLAQGAEFLAQLQQVATSDSVLRERAAEILCSISAPVVGSQTERLKVI